MLRGIVKDTVRTAIHAMRNPGRTRERIADILGTTAAQIQKKVEVEDPRHIGAHEVPAFVAVLGDDLIQEIARACGGVFVRLSSVEQGDESICELLLDTLRVNGELAAALLDAVHVCGPGGRVITQDELLAIERAGQRVQEAYQQLLAAARREAQP